MSMKKVAIISGDILTPLGDLETTWSRLLEGECGLVECEFSEINTKYSYGVIPNLVCDLGSWSRLDEFFKQLLLGLVLPPGRTHVFLATTKGAVDEIIKEESGVCGQPYQLADYLIDQYALPGTCTTTSAACSSGTIAIIQGAQDILSNRCDNALIIAVDLLAKFIITGFDSLKALSPSRAKPFDSKRDGLSLGEGGGWMVLSSEKQVREYALPTLGWVSGWGISCDATHITAPCRKGSGLKRVFTQVQRDMDGMGVSLGGINAHGTGTVYNDAMELLVFNERCGEKTPVCSVKGALGHSLGATGMVEAMLSVMGLRDKALPPTAGLSEPEKTHCALSGTEPIPLLAPSVVSCNSGFGGINGAILLTE